MPDWYHPHVCSRSIGPASRRLSAPAAFARALPRCLAGLRLKRRVPYSVLSTGQKQRMTLAKSLVNDPALLFLDKPTLGLDPDVSVRVREHIARLRREQGITIVLTTHYMREADELCDEIAFIKDG